MNGHMYISDKPVQPVEIYSPIEDMAIISNNEVLSVFFKCPPFHSHIPSRSVGLIVPCKSIRKRDILPPAVLWHEKSAVLGRIHSERSIHKSISGHILAKLAHRLLSKCYPSMHLKKGSMELGDKIGADGLAWPLNVGSTICELGIRADKKSVDNGVPDKQVGETGANGLARFNGVRDNSFIDGKSRKRKWNCVGETGANGLVCASDVPDNHLGAKGLSSFSNLLPTVCEVGSGADKNCVASGVPDNQAGETGANGLVCICLVCAKGVLDKDYFHREYKKESRALFKAKRLQNLEPTIGTGADKSCVDNGVQDNHVGEIGAKALTYSSGVPNNHVGGTGAKALTYSSGVPNNLVGETGAKALTYSSGVPNNHVGETGANGLVCASGVPDNHLGAKGVSCLSNLLPTVCEVGSGADKNCVANGVPDNQVGEMGANGKSKKKRRKKSKAKGAQNLEPTIGTGADKNCVDNGVQNNHVGETGTKALTYSSGAPNNHVGETGAKALTYSSGVPNNHVGGTGAEALTYSSGVPNNLVGETGAKALTYSSGVPNNHVGETGANGLVCASGVPDNHLGAKGVSCLSNLLPTVCEVGSGADKNCVANGVPDNQVGETGANGKSKKKRRKKSKAKGAQNLEPTKGTGADKNCVDNGVQNNHVGETGGKALTYSSGVPNNHVGETGAKALTYSSGVPNNHVGETGAKALTYSSGVPNNHVGANGLVCASGVLDKKFVDVKCKKRKRKQSKVRGAQNLERHALPAEVERLCAEVEYHEREAGSLRSKLLRVQQEALEFNYLRAEIGAKASTYSSGVPNNHVGETGAKALTYSGGVPNNQPCW
uniref:Uncharacterized protein n=1 Tax=Fagus sylvatica TaxID=28930 RepID=A0A2N9GLY9_FAGSY